MCCPQWLPLCRNGKLTCGEFNLPVMQEEPPANYSYIFPDVLLPGTRWIDNHKPIFSITLDAHTTVHPLVSSTCLSWSQQHGRGPISG